MTAASDSTPLLQEPVGTESDVVHAFVASPGPLPTDYASAAAIRDSGVRTMAA